MAMEVNLGLFQGKALIMSAESSGVIVIWHGDRRIKTVPELDIQQLFQYLVNHNVFDLEEMAEYARKAHQK